MRGAGWSRVLCWVALLLCQVRPAGAADWLATLVHELQPWSAREAAESILNETAETPVATAWQTLVAASLLNAPGLDPRRLQLTQRQLLSRTAELSAAWLAEGHAAAGVALAAALAEAQGGRDKLPPELLAAAAEAAAEDDMPQASAWLSAWHQRPGQQQRAAAAFGRWSNRRGQVEQALRWLAEAGGEAPWLAAELAARERARLAGRPLDLGLTMPSAVVLRSDELSRDLVRCHVTNRGEAPVVLALTVEIPGLTAAERRLLYLPAGASAEVVTRPPLLPSVLAEEVPRRPVGVAVNVTLDTDHGQLVLWDTQTAVPVVDPPVGVPTAPTLSDPTPEWLSRARAHFRPKLTPGLDALLAAAATAPSDPALGSGQALAFVLAGLGCQAAILTSAQTTLVGLLDTPPLGLVRQVDEVGAPVKPTGELRPHATGARWGFVVTDSGDLAQLDPNRDGLPTKRGQALGWAILPPTPPTGSVRLSPPGATGQALWIDPEALASHGTAVACAAGADQARTLYLAALAETAPTRATALAAAELTTLRALAQPLESLLEGRYDVRYRDCRGASFFGPARPAAEPRDVPAAAQGLVDRLDGLLTERYALQRLQAISAALAGNDPAQAALAAASLGPVRLRELRPRD